MVVEEAGIVGVRSREKAGERARERTIGGSWREEGGERNMQGKNTRRDVREMTRALLGTKEEKEIDSGSDEWTAWEERTMVDKRGRHGHFSPNICLPPSISQSASTMVIPCPLAVLE